MQWTSKNTKEQGDFSEQKAQQFLIENGLILVTKNFRCKLGEIDLIMNDESTLVFIEVKYRKSSQFGLPCEAVSATKQKKLVNTANYYLQQQGINAYNTDCRFDVVGLAGPIESSNITWLKNAF